MHWYALLVGWVAIWLPACRHENIVDLFCCFVVGDNLWLVMPLMDKGSCYYALRMLRKAHKLAEGQGLQEEVIATIMRDLLNALDYIHKHGQVSHAGAR